MVLKGGDLHPTTIRLKSRQNDRLEAHAESVGKSKAEVVREALANHLPEESESHSLPEDPELREVYLWLRERTDEHNNINAGQAINELSQVHGMKEDFVKLALLDPLVRTGWIDANFGTIHVNDRAVVDDD